MLLCCIAVSAQRFEVDGIYYSILSTEDKTIKVSGHNNETCQDCVSIPETIENNGVVYTVITSVFMDITTKIMYIHPHHIFIHTITSMLQQIKVHQVNWFYKKL